MNAGDLTLAILAGGKGSRLGGVAKGLLLREGLPFIGWGLKLGALASRTLIVSSDPGYDRFGVERFEDVEPRRGAPGGLVTALLSSATQWTLVIACDMPFVTLEAAGEVIAAAGAHDVSCFEREGRREPMLAVYRSSLGARWRPRLADDPSLMKLLSEVTLCAISPSDPRALDSINTVDQLRSVKS